ncbi:hypothetical protein D0864_02105 [Hortaea werneckii]|uniref:DUF221-domain-containing protein n=1 Tax=Hortaea werneckii TaxID=91943 RepID=A0A3M7H1L0_HORWE|nr:DUF221-domain-containing protein [Hortaea werneckii]KAI7352956.1 DUF221-domain-containing protein [Hortaea werneckii]RMZ06877.1 hypothetical protein D0862_04461 [Hortaea werneckii]RMZ07008.1 hypothetical protein D0864_02105 [Hortaea werneckii]
MATNNSDSNSTSLSDVFYGNSGIAQNASGISTRAFFLNLATGFVLFTLQLSGFLLLKSSRPGRRLYQPKTYLVQKRLRVEAIPVSPLKWLRRIFGIKGEELKEKCGLDGYFSIRFLRAMVIIFLPLMAACITILIPTNFIDGKNQRDFVIEGNMTNFNVTGLDTVSWQNVPPTQTDRYWAHLVCALLVISWTLYRIYREKIHFVTVRQQYLTSPEHRLKASAKTILVTNIPSEYRSEEALKALFDVFVDNDDRSKLHVWVNRDYKVLRALATRRRKMCHALEKEELKLLRVVNKQYQAQQEPKPDSSHSQRTLQGSEPDEETEVGIDSEMKRIQSAFEADNKAKDQLWRSYLEKHKESRIQVIESDSGSLTPASTLKFWQRNRRDVSKVAFLRAEIARLTIQIEELLPQLDNEEKFKRQNSAFIQFDRQMAANMACALTSHHKPGIMEPRFLHVAPHEILWPNMGLTSLARFVRTIIAFVLFAGMLVLWAVPAFFLSVLSQLETLRSNTPWLRWLEAWPTWLVSFISGPLTAILLALLVQLVVPALCRKLAVLCGAPTRSRREIATQGFYFTFLIIELVLVTSISSGLLAVIPVIASNPTRVTQTLATNLPKAANYFFNYLIIQALGFSGSALFQYLRILFITLIWPWFSQTPREEAWLQITLPHQMWANVFSLWTNFAVIGMIYSVIAPLMLVFVSAVFMLFWVAYRHNYYYVQRNKVDTHGALFEGALSQLFAGVYVMEITLIGLFFIVRNTDGNVTATPQAVIMIVALCLTAGFHYVLEQSLRPLKEFIPVTLEDKAADAERRQFAREKGHSDENAVDDQSSTMTAASSRRSSESIRRRVPEKPSHMQDTAPEGEKQAGTMAYTAASARKTMNRLHQRIGATLAAAQVRSPHHGDERDGTAQTRKDDVADQLGAAIAGYPDDLVDLTPAERAAELRAAYQDPVTREPAPVVWIPQDAAGVSDDSVAQSKKYGKYLQYSNAGAFLGKSGKTEVVQPAPDVRSDWLLDWRL